MLHVTMLRTLPISPSPSEILSRQARQDRLELVENLSLDSGIIHSRLVVCITRANGNIAVPAPEQDDISLPGQARATAPFCIAGAKDASVDASKDELELAGVAASGVGNFGKVDVQECVCGQVRLATFDDGASYVKSEVGVDFAVERRGGVPSSRLATLA